LVCTELQPAKSRTPTINSTMSFRIESPRDPGSEAVAPAALFACTSLLLSGRWLPKLHLVPFRINDPTELSIL
jgi:hypothetical protein